MSALPRIGVAGSGHFGRFHALKLAKAGWLSGVHDRNPERAAQVAAEVGAPALDLDGLLAVSHAVVIATPAATHAEVAVAALGAGKHVLIEKPIAATLAEADHLAELATGRGLVLQVGHIERFSAAQGAIRERAGRPLFIEASRVGPFKPRGTDVSVVLDLMIHDLDLVLGLVQAPLEFVDAVGAPVASELPDIAHAWLRFTSGATAILGASRVAARVDRRMHILGNEALIAVDFGRRSLNVTARSQDGPHLRPPGFGTSTVSWQEHDPLEAEHAAFVAAIRDGAPVLADAAAGRRALEAALRIEAAISDNTKRMTRSGLLDQFHNGFGRRF